MCENRENMSIVDRENMSIVDRENMSIVDRDVDRDTDKNASTDERVAKFAQEFHEHGLGCGNEIANVVKEIHPDALIIVPLYRSCITIEQSEEEKKNGVCTLHAYADPHWLGGEIDIDTLKKDDFHFEFTIQGDRQAPMILNKKINDDDKYCDNKCDEGFIAEFDEN